MTRSILKTVFWNLIIAAAYIVSGLWGLQLAFVDSNVTLLWPPSGIAMAGLCYWRLNAVPGILIGAVLTNLLNGADRMRGQAAVEDVPHLHGVRCG